MRRATLRGGAALMAVATLLSACTFYPKVVIFNHTGQDLIVHVDDRGLVGWNETPSTIKNGKARKLRIGAVFQTDRRFVISQQGCRYTYQQPEGDSVYWDRESDVYVVLQVEPDHRIHIRPPGRDLIPASGLPPLQSTGFPLRPVAKDCG